MAQGQLLIRLRSSRSLLVFLFGLHLLAALSVWLPSWPVWMALLFDAVVAASLWRSTRSTNVSLLRLEGDGRVSLADAAGHWQSYAVAADSAVLPFLVVLRLRPSAASPEEAAGAAPFSCRGGAVRNLVLPPDALVEAGQFRALRVWLRWRAGASGARNA